MYSAVSDRLVTPREVPFSVNATGPFYVTDQCILCALPVETALANIQWHYEAGCTACPRSCHVIKQPEDEDELAAVIAAMLGSCVQAIRYRGSDPAILRRLVDLGAGQLCDAL